VAGFDGIARVFVQCVDVAHRGVLFAGRPGRECVEQVGQFTADYLVRSFQLRRLRARR
jgi:hypothetical protein